MIEKSIYNTDDKKDKTFIKFKEGCKLPDGYYYIKSGIHPPCGYNPSDISSRLGAMCVVGYHIDTKAYWVLDECEFDTYDPIIEGNDIISEGCVDSFNQLWHRFYCSKCYCTENENIIMKARKELRESRMINPRPRIIEADVADSNVAFANMWNLRKRNRLFYPMNGLIMDALSRFDITKSKKPEPAAMALVNAIAGFEQSPWRY